MTFRVGGTFTDFTAMPGPHPGVSTANVTQYNFSTEGCVDLLRPGEWRQSSAAAHARMHAHFLMLLLPERRGDDGTVR